MESHTENSIKSTQLRPFSVSEDFALIRLDLREQYDNPKNGNIPLKRQQILSQLEQFILKQ